MEVAWKRIRDQETVSKNPGSRIRGRPIEKIRDQVGDTLKNHGSGIFQPLFHHTYINVNPPGKASGWRLHQQAAYISPVCMWGDRCGWSAETLHIPPQCNQSRRTFHSSTETYTKRCIHHVPIIDLFQSLNIHILHLFLKAQTTSNCVYQNICSRH